MWQDIERSIIDSPRLHFLLDDMKAVEIAKKEENEGKVPGGFTEEPTTETKEETTKPEEIEKPETIKPETAIPEPARPQPERKDTFDDIADRLINGVLDPVAQAHARLTLME